MATAAITLERDRFTWSAYFLIAYFGFFQGVLGPSTPFLRDELHINYSVAAFHLSGFSLGIVLAGMFVDSFCSRWGRSLVIWWGSAGMAAGGMMLAVGFHPLLTIPGTFVMGLFGGLSVITVQSALIDKYAAQRAAALMESMIAVGVTSIIVPLLVGSLEGIGISWRFTCVVGVFAWLYLFLNFYHQPIPEIYRNAEPQQSKAKPLPLIFWLYCLILVVIAGAQWCMIFWAAEYLDTVIGLQTDLASAMVSFFSLALVIGRFVGSRTTHRVDPRKMLVRVVLGALVCFPIFWLVRFPPLNVAGLFLTGFAMSNLFPLTVSLAVGTAPDQVDRTNGRTAVASGIAVLIIPQLLGAAADHVGIEAALGLIPVQLIVMLLVILMTLRYEVQKEKGISVNV